MWLGIDPGRSKCGWAIVGDDGGLCVSGIIPSVIPTGWIRSFGLTPSAMQEALAPWTIECLALPDSPARAVILGDGTGHRDIKSQLTEALELEIIVERERSTTLAARRLYWKIHAPGGLWRLVPTSLRIPPRDIDDLAAWAIVLRKIEKGEM